MKKSPSLKIKETAFIKKTNFKWVLTITVWTFLTSVMLAFVSDGVMPRVHMAISFAILLFFISLGILFDIIGLAIATANEEPFHSMASRRVRGAKEAVALIRNAEKASSFCNDVIGDISGIISGAATVAVVLRIAPFFEFDSVLLSLIFTGLVASLTVGGKAIGKAYAISHANRITYGVALFKHYFYRLFLRRGAKDGNKLKRGRQ